MRVDTVTESRWVRAVSLGIVVALSGVLAVLLHRAGHTQGDDFALYLRQARSLFDGDTGAVIADNRFSVLNSDAAFSPIGYPWGWPLLLSPFVHLWGFDYGRLKLVEIAAMMVWLVLLHGIVRRRIGRLAALAVVGVVGTAPLFLLHTDQLLTEFPHFVAVGVFLWWYDRIRSRATLLTASRTDLLILGALGAVVFNVRREGIVLVGVIVVMQLFDVIVSIDGRRTPAAIARHIAATCQAIITPLLSFAVGAALFQLLLPTALFPDNGNAASFIDNRLGELPGTLGDQLGFGQHPLVGLAVIALATAGAVIGVRRRPRLDGPLLLLILGSTLLISTHLRRVDRYWFQVTPWILYFATVALVAIGRAITVRRRYLVRIVVLLPLAAVVMAHLVVLPGKIGDARDFNSAGLVQSGPTNPKVAPIFSAVEQFTPPDAVIAYYRARTMTLLTDRRSFQTIQLARIEQNADYFAQRRGSTYWQPTLDLADARLAGFVEVWSDATWVLWRTPGPSDG